MPGHLSDEIVNTKLDGILKAFQKTGAFWRRGILTEEEVRKELAEGFFSVFMTFFKENCLELRLDKENYACFAGEFEAYQSGSEPAASAHLPWLYDTEKTPCEAAGEDRRQFFRLMNVFHVAPDYFKAPEYPENMAVPDRVPVHTYHSSCVMGTHFNCVDDGGLVSDESPVGKTFTLENDLGLRAVLTVREDRRNKDRHGLDFDEMVCPAEEGMLVLKAEFLAEGYIDGYTSHVRKHNPEVLIRLADGGKKVFWLAYREDGDDWKAYREHPLWHDYYCHLDRQEDKTEKVLEKLWNEYILSEACLKKDC